MNIEVCKKCIGHILQMSISCVRDECKLLIVGVGGVADKNVETMSIFDMDLTNKGKICERIKLSAQQLKDVDKEYFLFPSQPCAGVVPLTKSKFEKFFQDILSEENLPDSTCPFYTEHLISNCNEL